MKGKKIRELNIAEWVGTLEDYQKTDCECSFCNNIPGNLSCEMHPPVSDKFPLPRIPETPRVRENHISASAPAGCYLCSEGRVNVNWKLTFTFPSSQPACLLKKHKVIRRDGVPG